MIEIKSLLCTQLLTCVQRTVNMNRDTTLRQRRGYGIQQDITMVTTSLPHRETREALLHYELPFRGECCRTIERHLELFRLVVEISLL